MVAKVPGKNISKGTSQGAERTAARVAGEVENRATAALGSEEIAASQAQAPGALGVVETVAAAPSNMYMLAGGAAAGWLGEKVAASGKSRNWGAVEKVGTVMATPKRWYTSLSFGDLSEKFGMKGAFTKVSQPLFNGAGVVADKVGGFTGFNNWRANTHFGKAASAHQNALELAGNMKLEHAPTPQIRSALHDMQSAVSGTTHASQIDHVKFARGQEALKEIMDGHKGKFAGETKTLLKNAEKLGGKVEKAVYHNGQSVGYKNVRQAFKEVPGKISNAKAGPALMHASFVALSALSIAGDTKSFSHNLASLRAMYLDMTGEKEVSNARLLIGSVPAPVAAARKALVANFSAKVVLDAINIGLNVKMNRIGGFVKSTVAFMGIQMLSSGVDSVVNTSVLPFYKGISDAKKQGKTISAEAYAEFLTLASKDMGTRGKDDAVVQAVAEQFAAEQIAPAALLKEVENGKLMVRVHAVIDANEAKAPKEISQVAKLQGAPQAAMPVKGEHSAKVVAQAQNAAEQGRVL
jgi:hypothetical protein